jgi:hypothetical protein
MPPARHRGPDVADALVAVDAVVGVAVGDHNIRRRQKAKNRRPLQKKLPNRFRRSRSLPRLNPSRSQSLLRRYQPVRRRHTPLRPLPFKLQSSKSIRS